MSAAVGLAEPTNPMHAAVAAAGFAPAGAAATPAASPSPASAAGEPAHGAASPGANQVNPAADAAASGVAWTANGRLQQHDVTDNDCYYGVAIHLSVLGGFVLWSFFPPAVFAPLVLWLIRRNQSAFNDDHGREIINFGISLLILHVILADTLVGLLLIPVLWVVAVISVIRAARAASNGEYFRYPMTFRLL